MNPVNNMNIGTDKMKNFHPVPYVIEKDKSEKLLDIYSKLMKERTVMLSGEINSELAERIVAQLLILEAESPDRPIFININSGGGSIIDGLYIIDTMQMISCPVYTLCGGAAFSMAAVILISGMKAYALENSSLMVHQASSGMRGTTIDLEIATRETKRLQDVLVTMLARKMKASKEYVNQFIDRDRFMSAQEALQLGIIEGLVPSRKPSSVSTADISKS